MKECMGTIIEALEYKVEPEIPDDFEAKVMMKITDYVSCQKQSKERFNLALAVLMGMLLLIPTTIGAVRLVNLSFYEIVMGLIMRISVLLDIFTAVLFSVKFISRFAPDYAVLFNLCSYGGLAMLFITVFVSGKMLTKHQQI